MLRLLTVKVSECALLSPMGRLLLVLIAGVVARLLAAVVLAGWDGGGPLMMDARSFHHAATVYARNWFFRPAIDYELYTNLLGLVYAVLGDDRLIGNLTSVCGYAVFSLLLYRIFRYIGCNGHSWSWMLIVVMLPAGVIFTSITLRESWQLVALAWIMLGLLHYCRSAGVRSLVHVAGGAAVFGVLHKAMVMYSAALVMALAVAALLRSLRIGRKRSGQAASVLLIVAAVGGTAAIAHLKIPGAGLVYGILDRNPLVQIAEYREVIESERPRSAFDVGLDTSSYPALFGSLGSVYLRYMFGPAPWSVQTGKDLYAALESLLRLVLLVAALSALAGSSPGRRRDLLLLGLVYLSLTLFWTLGTTNYGQAVRHHVLTNWLLALMGGDRLVGWIRGLVPGRNRVSPEAVTR